MSIFLATRAATVTRGSGSRTAAAFTRFAFAALALAAAASSAAAQQAIPDDGPDKRALEMVHFASLDGKTDLTAYLGRHPGDKPRPAVVLMHGCSGLLNPRGRIFPIFRAWMRALFARGYDVLTVDSAASRGFGQTCSAGPDRITMWRDRPKDAYAALAYLQARPIRTGRSRGADGLVAGRRRGAADHQRQEHRPPAGVEAGF
jgi:predicted alpha/beta-fold hydrolase